jgi:hypothetical protein
MKAEIVPFLHTDGILCINSISVSSGIAAGMSVYYILKTTSDIGVSAVKTGIRAGGTVLTHSIVPIGEIPVEVISICSNIAEYTADKILSTIGNTSAIISGVVVGIASTVIVASCTKIVEMIKSISINETNIVVTDEDDFQVVIYDISGNQGS